MTLFEKPENTPNLGHFFDVFGTPHIQFFSVSLMYRDMNCKNPRAEMISCIGLNLVTLIAQKTFCI